MPAQLSHLARLKFVNAHLREDEVSRCPVQTIHLIDRNLLTFCSLGYGDTHDLETEQEAGTVEGQKALLQHQSPTICADNPPMSVHVVWYGS